MDKIFIESDYQFDFTNSINVYESDKKSYNDLPDVDFVVETEVNYFFIEIKNPDNIKAKEKSKSEFLSELHENLHPYKIADKFKSMLLRKWALGADYEKPILCVYILEFNKFTKTDRAKLKEKIFQRIPFSLNKKEFGGRKIFEKRFELLNIDEFKEMFSTFTIEAAS